MERKVIDLTKEKELREELMNEERIDILEKVKQINTLPNTDLTTTKFLANYFVISKDTVKKVIRRHKEELESNGMRYNNKSEILEILRGHGVPLEGLENIASKIPNRGMNLFPKRAVLNFAMLLTESKVAEEIRAMLLDNHFQLEAIHNKLKSGKEITQEDIDKSSPTYYQDKELELRKKIEECKKELSCAVIDGDLDKVLVIQAKVQSYNNEINKLKEEKISGLEKDIDMLKIHSLTITESRSVLNALIRATAPKIKKGYGETWTEFYKHLNYKLGINIRSRKGSGSLLDRLSEEEIYKAEIIARNWAYDLGVDVKKTISLTDNEYIKEIFG